MSLIKTFFRFIWKDNGQRKERDAFLNWLSKHIGSSEYILAVQNKSLYKLFFEAPFKIGDKPKKEKWLRENKNLSAFILIKKGQEKFLPFSLDDNWFLIGEGFFYSLYENKNRFRGRPLPLRFGLSPEEKKQAIKIARWALEKFLESGKRPGSGGFRDDQDIVDLNNLSRRFFMPIDLDVALWVKGKLRGSCVIQNKELREGIIEAAVGASQDQRFKPLNLEELNEVEIEITLISDLHLPLPESFIEKNELLADKGFVLKIKDKTGWFLPEVFNVKHFRDLTEFLDELAMKKAGLAQDAWRDKKAGIEIFEVEDFLEDKTGGINNLYGPIINSETNLKNLRERAEMAADWLINIQEPDGNFPPITDPLTGRQTQIDWPRSAFSGWALAEFGGFEKNEKYVKAAQKNFQYINTNFKRGLFLPINNFLLTAAYAGQEALALYKNSQRSDFYLAAKNYAQEILNNSHKLNFEPIAFQQIGSFLISLAAFERNFLEEGIRFIQIAADDFENNLKNNRPMNLAVQAELINVFFKMFELTRDIKYLEYAKKITEWLLSYQLIQGPEERFGPFMAAENSDFVYTRGTGKIFEVLALLPEFRKEAEAALAWILAMQYTEENTFFVPSEIRPKIVGGFRHDYFNPEAWIDSAGHFLLGAIRFLNR